MFTTNEKILALRHRHKMSQGEVAELLGMSRPTYIGRENGDTFWRLDELNTLAETFGVTVKELIGDCENETMQ